jgi:hypothetical protein
MSLTRNRLYLLLLAGCLAGYAWLFFTAPGVSGGAELCPIRRVTGIPCPSCGSTRAVRSLMDGDVIQALLINPFGMLIFAVLLLAPAWILYDLLRRKDTLYICYRRMEIQLGKPYIAIPLVLLVVANWIWNIIKGL